MIAFILAGTAWADPGACVPGKDAPGSGATGFCLDEDEYAEIGRLRAQISDLQSRVAAREAEIAAFDEWKKEHDADMLEGIDKITSASASALEREQQSCDEELSRARRRSPLERGGFAIGAVVGVAATVGTTALVLDAYGKILE